MTPPSPMTRLIGHPVVAGALLLAGMPFVAFSLLHGSQGVVPAVIVGALLNRVMKAQERERDYRAWKSAWDAMSGSTTASAHSRKLAVRTAIVMLAALFCATHLGDGQVQLGIAFVALALMLWATATLMRRFGLGAWRSRRAQTEAVTISLRGPLLPVPSLPQAYAALPDYCQQLIRRR
jgi:hypothetical protein